MKTIEQLNEEIIKNLEKQVEVLKKIIKGHEEVINNILELKGYEPKNFKSRRLSKRTKTSI